MEVVDVVDVVANNDVMYMVNRALQGMWMGIIGVFAVLALFYVVLRLMMARVKEEG